MLALAGSRFLARVSERVLVWWLKQVSAYFTGCRVVSRISNLVGLDNGEYGVPVLQCSGLTSTWAQLWPQLRHYE